MTCPWCQAERTAEARFCGVCGARFLEGGETSQLAELAHVRYLLRELPGWDVTSVPSYARRYVRALYERRERALEQELDRLRGRVAQPGESAPPLSPSEVEGPRPTAERGELDPVKPEPSAAPRLQASGPRLGMNGGAARPKGSQPLGGNGGEAAAPASAQSHEPPSTPLGVNGGAAPPAVEGPPEVFDIPPRPETAAEQVVAAASPWNEVWRPFLTEKVGWFLGAFLIVAGGFYFVAESWAGMTSLARTLVVFGMTAGYSAAFFAVGGALARREGLSTAGFILRLIGAAIAPLAALPLAYLPPGSAPLSFALLAAWAAGSTWLLRPLAEGRTARERGLGLALWLGALGVLACAPLLTALGGGAFWLGLLAVGACTLLARPAREGESPGQRAFVLLGGVYLALLVVVRLHLLLAAGPGAPLALGSYAPLLSLLGAGALRAFPLSPERRASPATVAVAAFQLACLGFAVTGAAPAFFLCALLLCWTTGSLAAGGEHRASWLYGFALASHLAYQTCGQLVPGAVTQLILEVKLKLGYVSGAPLPIHYDALYAFLWVAVLAFYARALARRGRPLAAGALWRSTAVAAAVFSGLTLGLAEQDLRPALWCLPAYAALCLVLGFLEDRDDLRLTGAAISLAVPAVLGHAHGDAAVALSAGASAVLLSLSSLVPTRISRVGLSVAALLHAGMLALWALTWPASLVTAGALAAAGLSALLVARNLDQRWLLAPSASLVGVAALLAAEALVPGAQWVVCALLAVAFALLADRDGRPAWLRPGALLFALWACAGVLVYPERALPLEAPLVFALSSAALWLAARRTALLALPASLLLALLLSPGAWLELLPLSFEQSALAMAALCALASAWHVRGGGLRARLLAAVALPMALACAHTGGALALALAAGAALVASRALHSWLTLPIFAVLGFAALRALHLPLPRGGPLELSLWWAAALAALPLVGRVRPVRALLGEAPLAWASLAAGALCVALGGVVTLGSLAPSAWAALPALATALLWRRTTGWALLDALPVAAVVAVAYAAGPLASTFAPPLAALALTHALREPRAASLLQGERPSISQAQTLAAFSLLLLPTAPEGDSALWLLRAGALVLCAGPLWPVRVVLAAGLAALALLHTPVPMLAALALAVAVRFAPRQVEAVLGVRPGKWGLVAAGLCALLLGALQWRGAPDSVLALLLTAGTTLAVAWLLRVRWLLPLAVLQALCAPHFVAGAFGPVEAQAQAGALLVLSGLVLWLRQRPPRGASPFGGEWTLLARPLWAGALLALAAILILPGALGRGSGGAVPEHAYWALLAACTLLAVTREPAELLVSLTAWLLLPPALGLGMHLAPLNAHLGGAWSAAAVSLAGLALWPKRSPRTAAAVRAAAWLVTSAALIALPKLRSVEHPLVLALVALVAWLSVAGWRRLHGVAWALTTLAAHGALAHVGLVLSTGRPKTELLPFVGLASALLSAAAARWAPKAQRPLYVHALAGLSLAEVAAAGLLVSGGGAACALATVAACAVLCGVLALQRASTAYAPLPLLVGYVAVRLQSGAQLGQLDVLVALVSGVVFGGLHLWASRSLKGAHWRAPALFWSFAFPLCALLVAPWNAPEALAPLLMGYAAHFTALSRLSAARRWGASLGVAAFNGALLCAWLALGRGEPQFFAIPAGLSLIWLVHAFREELGALAQARLRAAAITLTYVAAAWRPLMFEEPRAMLVCVALCVVGVAVGIALRIRSYVYLGAAFLVTTVLANLVRYGVRDHRLGALFLSALGVAIVTFMVVLSARRAQLLERYRRVRDLLEQWEG